jgi:hypothetical protein
MASKKKIITGVGTLSGETHTRKARFRVTRTDMYVNELQTPVGSAYSDLSITDSDDFPDGNYELDYLGQKELLTKKSGSYLARR